VDNYTGNNTLEPLMRTLNCVISCVVERRFSSPYYFGEKDRLHALEVVKIVIGLLEKVFPTVSDSVSQSNRRYMEEREKKYEEWLQDQGITIVDAAKMNEKERGRYGRSKFDALT